ncbi:hypothetical protein ACFVHB_23780 [Kitasatospora sp. NPDC127111]|uniref:hypothetical protein n=1 Tax=Kitasatospora sp. NPDC127111 TaxID=3345363 RepID=UPI0036270259
MISEPGTIDDLVADAAAAGHQVTKRLIHDWVARGLLAQPQRRRTGQRGSEKALHTGAQRALFLDLLHMRQPSSVRPLAEVVLVCWLFIGDDNVVSTRQALRALRTYVGDPRGSRAWAKTRAAQFVQPLCDPRLGTPRSRRELLKAFTEAFYMGTYNREDLIAKCAPQFEDKIAFRDVVQSLRRGPVPGRPESLLMHLDVVLQAGKAVQDGVVDQDALEEVRVQYLRIRGADAEWPDRSDLEGAMAELLVGLGVVILARSRGLSPV